MDIRVVYIHGRFLVFLVSYPLVEFPVYLLGNNNKLSSMYIFFKVSILDINEEIGNKAINQLENKYKEPGKILFVKCDVTDKNAFEGKRV